MSMIAANNSSCRDGCMPHKLDNLPLPVSLSLMLARLPANSIQEMIMKYQLPGHSMEELISLRSNDDLEEFKVNIIL